jgi:hypothetical protein
MVVAPRSFFCQPHESRVRLSSKLGPRVQDPVVITSWKEIAGIEARGELEITGRRGIAEPQHVDLGRPGRNPAHSLVVDLDELTDIVRLCATNALTAMEVRNCARDEGRPLDAGRQGQASNHRKLRRSKAVVVSVAKKAGHDPVR